MSIQTTVLENGRWVIRNVDPYRVRAQNTETPRKEQSQPSVSLPKTPCLGILTKTLARSPVINQIIPARIRHTTKNDVLFISANSVTIKEAKRDYTLREVATKTDFDSTIKSARIFGERRRLTRHEDSSTRLSQDPDFLQHALTNEDDDSDAEEDDGSIDGKGHQRQLPPHILMLALESSRIVFLCAVSGRSDDPDIWSSQKVLPAPTSPLQSLGELMAVDPKSRAVAVAAHEEKVYLYALKSMSEMRREFRGESLLEPIKEERLIVLDGTILKMEFLHPPEKESDRIILVLVVERDGQSRIIWYDWNADMPLHQAQLRPNKTLLHPNERLPLLLIPLKKNAALMLVCEKHIVLINDLLTGDFHRFSYQYSFEQEPREAGASLRRPVWVQWAPSLRCRKMKPNHEYIILCREDGIIQHIVFDHTKIIYSGHNDGRLGINVNTSFAAVDFGAQKGEMLIAGGDESDGGLWAFSPYQTYPDQRGVIANWTPIKDFAVGNVLIDRQNAGTASVVNIASKGQQKLFACSGRGQHGAISEIRYGVEASTISRTVNLDKDSAKGVLGVWAFHGVYRRKVDSHQGRCEYLEDVTYVILSHPLQTDLLQLWLKQKQGIDAKGDDVLEPERDLIRDDLGFDLNARTIIAGRTLHGLIIQITETSLRATSLPMSPVPNETIKKEDTEDQKPDKAQLDAEEPQPRYAYFFENSRILAACLHNGENKTIIVLAVQNNGRFYLEFGAFATEYQPLDQRVPLPAPPSCLSLLQTGDETFILVGTLAGEMEIYLPGNIGSDLLELSSCIRHAFAGPFGICDSIAAISRNTSEGVQQVLVCGLRNGSVEILTLSKEMEKCGGHTFLGPLQNLYMLTMTTDHLSLIEKMAFGHTSVTALKDTTTNRAIIHCENTIWTLEYPARIDEALATVHNVWITDPNEPLFQQGGISVVSQVIPSWLPGQTPGVAANSFVCIDGDRIHTILLDSQPKMVPRRLELGGTPVSVLYSIHVDKLIVLHNKMEIVQAPRQLNGQPHVRGIRALRPMISFLASRPPSIPITATGRDPDAMDIDREEEPNRDHTITMSECKHGEEYLGMTEWPLKFGRKEFDMLVINTTLSRSHKQIGRLLIFAITKGESNEPPKLMLKKAFETARPVYCVATCPNMWLVYCCGNNLYTQTLEVTEAGGTRLSKLIEIPMRSPARHITVKEPYIYVSSSRESLSVYRHDAGQLTYQFGDQYARCGLHHLQLPSQSLILASDTAGSVVGLWQPPERRIDNSMTTVFEAALPSSITRLRRIARPIWSSGRLGGGDDDGDRLSGPEDETILGSATDGTLIQMSVLSDSEWRLLRFVQNMAERHHLICPHHPGNPHKRHIEPSTARPRQMHINGDILERVLDRGGASLLSDMLDVEPDLESRTDFGSKQDRRERFEELAKEVLDEEGRDELLGKLVLWLQYRLRNAL